MQISFKEDENNVLLERLKIMKKSVYKTEVMCYTYFRK